MTHPPPAAYGHATIPTDSTSPSIALTPAEARVLSLLATYRTLAAIGEELGIGRPTVKTHVQHIYKKLGTHTRAGAVREAQQAGLITTPEE